jgi:hypothetical protein
MRERGGINWRDESRQRCTMNALCNAGGWYSILSMFFFYQQQEKGEGKAKTTCIKGNRLKLAYTSILCVLVRLRGCPAQNCLCKVILAGFLKAIIFKEYLNREIKALYIEYA